ncbi:hypothetical protein PFICI_03587 [Pestalotiopsis fici W106-1]|uniref:D-xylose 1-dehydrogenase (NADP(+), D-xylono-1,5-lactone-forming) n=1 Tax=Pestalotiopsis fici (strain W106-1 / CGMCC3.15140) TaxID=1229662 RepID=W3XJC8_PESFW|nr:uncharacterized protein PFICI_03587 [Pestalotiopsis fici W106-1]ETS85562.1 hypothetical protein PFICI_03587 [Pestalotiopsis fici W106-1]
MASTVSAFLSGLHRNWTMLNPPAPPKEQNALKFGILGAANIAPMAFISPAQSHPGVIIYAVAARDKTRATAFAKKHSIPVVKDSYDDLLNDPEIDAIYNPLPCGLHFEWTVKALAKGKHVLLEKPSTSNVQEAETLFRHPLLSQSAKPPVLMEAFHSRFTAAFHLFLTTLDQPNISEAFAVSPIPKFIAADDNIRYDYSIAGGSILDLGTYPVSALREAFGAEPTECTEANLVPMAAPRERCDHSFDATFKFPNGGIGKIHGSLRTPVTELGFSNITVKHRPVPAPEEEDAKKEGTQVTRTRTVIFYNFMLSNHYHRIDVTDEFEVTRDSSVVKRYTRKDFKKAYTFEEMGKDANSNPYWSTYRFMLEQFVNRIHGIEGSGKFISHEDSISQARALDMIYTKSGLGPRPNSKYWTENH